MMALQAVWQFYHSKFEAVICQLEPSSVSLVFLAWMSGGEEEGVEEDQSMKSLCGSWSYGNSVLSVTSTAHAALLGSCPVRVLAPSLA
mmetsp:Transcript_31912/g.77772  ORF Transcript_31912/g.77772 Transcript_31912/m.77772 type:complete len:88 (+) Transcript_31912:120-383(+)